MKKIFTAKNPQKFTAFNDKSCGRLRWKKFFFHCNSPLILQYFLTKPRPGLVDHFHLFCYSHLYVMTDPLFTRVGRGLWLAGCWKSSLGGYSIVTLSAHRKWTKSQWTISVSLSLALGFSLTHRILLRLLSTYGKCEAAYFTIDCCCLNFEPLLRIFIILIFRDFLLFARKKRNFIMD